MRPMISGEPTLMIPGMQGFTASSHLSEARWWKHRSVSVRVPLVAHYSGCVLASFLGDHEELCLDAQTPKSVLSSVAFCTLRRIGVTDLEFDGVLPGRQDGLRKIEYREETYKWRCKPWARSDADPANLRGRRCRPRLALGRSVIEGVLRRGAVGRAPTWRSAAPRVRCRNTRCPWETDSVHMAAALG